MTSPKHRSRRDFLKQAATAAGTGMVAGGLPQKARARGTPANDRIGVGIIGLGAMGTHHLRTIMQLSKESTKRVQVVAVCDVFSKRVEAAATTSGAKPYRVWSDLLADKRVDAVWIVTPDHWHAPMALAAAEAGKDIYCEKPMVHYDHLDLAKKVVETVAAKQRVMQVGTQGLSDDCWRLARKQVPSLGTILHAQGFSCQNVKVTPGHVDADAVPGKTLDWDMWLGCALTRVPKRPFDPLRYGHFRAFWDYSGGVGTDLFPHVLAPWVKTLDLGFPKHVVTVGGLYHAKDWREIPDTIQTCIDYEGGPTVSLLGETSSSREGPMLVRGQKASMVVRAPEEVDIIPEEAAGGGKPRVVKSEKTVPDLAHWRNFLACVRTRSKPIHDETFGYRVMVPIGLGIKSYRTRKSLGFDPQSGEIREL